MFALLSRIQIILVRVLFVGINNITFRSNRLSVRIPVGAFGERDQLFGEFDHGVKEDHRIGPEGGSGMLSMKNRWANCIASSRATTGKTLMRNRNALPGCGPGWSPLM